MSPGGSTPSSSRNCPELPPLSNIVTTAFRSSQGLQSLVVYGLHAPGAPEAPDAAGHASHATHVEPKLANTLAVVHAIGIADLGACATRVGTWHDRGLATPLILAAHEFANSLDA